MTVPAERQRWAESGPAPVGRPRLILPGLIPADPQVERYRVHPGAVTALELDAGDEMTVIDAAGRQRGELTVLGRNGEDFSALATSADTAATVLRCLADGGPVVGGPVVGGPVVGADRGGPRAVRAWPRSG